MSFHEVWRAGGVDRFHAVPGVQRQSVAAHSWGVAVIVDYIYPNASKDLLREALYHDAAELATGDIPAPVKRASPELKHLLDGMEEAWREINGVPNIRLSADEETVLKIADALDGMMYCLSRRRVGELDAEAIARKWYNYLADFEWMMLRLPRARALVDDVMNRLEGLV